MSRTLPPTAGSPTPAGNPAARAQDPLIGTCLDGRYRVESLVARGGMATVYRGADLRLDRTVAIKVMHPSFATDPGFVARFEREARAAARLSSPYAVAVHDQGTDGNVAGQHGGAVTYLVMEYVPGHTVRDVLRVHGALEPAAALAIIDPVLEALAAAHRAGYVHRDIKPENVLISDDGRVKVTDFGLARAIEGSDTGKTHGLLLGTVAYLSPEQVDQDFTDARSDVYSAGILLYEMLTGAVPFSAAAPMQVAYKHVHEDVPAPSEARPGLPAGIDELVLRATRRRPDQRFQDASAFLAAVRAIRGDLPAAPTWKPSPTDTLIVAAGAGPSVQWQADRLPVGPRPAPVPAAGQGGPPSADVDPVVAAEPDLDPWTETPVVPESWDDDPAPDGDHGQTEVHHGTTPDAVKPRQRRWRSSTRKSARTAPQTPPAVPEPSSGKRRTRIWVGVIALGCVVGLLAFLFGPLQRVTVPQVAGHTVKEATAMLAATNLKLDSDSRDYSETVPKGQIITSDPQGGSSARTGTTVTAVVSRGPERYDVPALAGVTRDEADVALKATKLAPGKVSEEFHDTVPRGEVIRTDPAKGASVKPGTQVALVVSKGPKPVDLPKLEGTNADQAAKTLRDLGVKVTVTKKISETVPAGDVISMSPKGGKTVDHGSTVKIVESKGPPMVTVPNVVGKSRADATAALEALGFKVKVDYPLIFGTFDRVHSQNPKAGTSIAKGSTVTIDVV